MVIKEIYFKITPEEKGPTEVFWGKEFVDAFKLAQTVSVKSHVVSDIIYGKDNDLLYFTKDRNHIKIKFNVKINGKEGKFIFIISLDDKIISKDIDLTKGLCLIDHPDFEKKQIYSIGGYYLETDFLFIVNKVRKYKNLSKKILL